MSSLDAATLYELPPDHPGVSDAAYRRRRAAIAGVGERYVSGGPIPDVEYTGQEDEVWRRVAAELTERHGRSACAEVRRGVRRLGLPTDRVPQLREVDAAVSSLTGFRLEPVPGLASTRVFYGALARRTFLSTQYIRHHSVPFYTPEPDIVHEIIGHANMLASPVLADLYEAAGRASLRAETDEALDFFSRVFWFTLEFGVLWEDGDLKAYGAGLLSSFGEIEVYRKATIRPWDIPAMGTLDYDIAQYQPVLFAGASFQHMVDELGALFDSYDDEAFGRLVSQATR